MSGPAVNLSGFQTPNDNVFAAPDDLTVEANGAAITGWKTVTVTRSCERVPSHFDISMTDFDPAGGFFQVLREGTPIQIKLGGDLVLTGYVDVYRAAINARRHEIQIMGRSASEDLVDSSITRPTLTIAGGTFLSIAQDLAQPYGITVKGLAKNSGSSYPQFNFAVGETGFEVIERIARYENALVYDDTDGTLLLADVAQTTHASGINEGVNVQDADVIFNMAERYQSYLPILLANSYPDMGAGPEVYGSPWPAIPDLGVPTTGIKGQKRTRTLIIESEQAMLGPDGNMEYVAQLRAQWEANRRYGRSQMLRVVVDCWRDTAGKLWAPNAVIPINMPSLHLQPDVPWVIGSVTFSRNLQSGTTAEIVAMPQQAFTVQPLPLSPFDALLVKAGAAAAKPNLSSAGAGAPATVRLVPTADGPSSP